MLDAVGDRRGAVVEIAGEPGIGKTRLLTELSAAAAHRGVTVARARSTELDQGVRFHPLAQALGEPTLSRAVDRLPTDLARIVDDQLRSARRATSATEHVDPAVHTALRELLGELARDGLVLLFDDFHWADRDTTRFVEFLTRYPVPGRLLLVIAQRTRQSCTQLRGALAHGVESGTIDRIDLPALTIDQAADLLGVPPDDARLPGLHRDSTGIPRYLLALSTSGKSPITIPRPREPEAAPELTTVFAGELTTLSADEAAVAHAVAVLGADCEVDTVAAVAELPRTRACAGASALLRRDVLRRADPGPGFGFRHPLLAQAVYAGLDPCWRVGAHRRAVTVLSRHGEPPPVLARHVERSLSLFEPSDLTLLADAARTVTATDPEQAMRWLRAAVRMADAAAQRTRLRSSLADTYVATGDVDAARTVLAEAVAQTPRTDHATRAAAIADAALLDCFRGRFAEAASGITVELAAIPADRPAPKVRLLVRQVIIGLFDGDLPEAEWLTEFAAAVGRHGDPIDTAGILALQGLASAYAGDLTAAATAVDGCAALVDTMTDDELTDSPDCLTILGLAERILARFADAERHLQRQLAILRQTGPGFLLPMVLLALSMTQHCVARLSEARGAANEAKRIAEKLGAQHIQYVAAMLESAYLTMTDRADASRLAIRLAEQAVTVRLPRNWWFGTHAVLWLASTLETAGEAQRCRSLLLNVGRGPELPRIPAGLRPRCFEMLAAASANDSDAAADWAARASAAADSGALPYHHGYASLAQGHALRAQGSHMSAARRYRTGADVLGGIGMIGEQIRALSFAAGSARAAGLTGDANAYLVLAKDLAVQCGANVVPPPAEHVSVPSIPGTRDPAADLSALTNREREIAGIARTGRRTRDIATELALSPRTVDVHLTRIYRKLGIGSRAELAHLMSNLD